MWRGRNVMTGWHETGPERGGAVVVHAVFFSSRPQEEEKASGDDTQNSTARQTNGRGQGEWMK